MGIMLLSILKSLFSQGKSALYDCVTSFMGNEGLLCNLIANFMFQVERTLSRLC